MSTTLRRAPSCWIRTATLFVSIVTASGAADATTLLKKNLDDLVRESDAIVVGTVSEIQAQYDASGDSHSFVTLTGLQVIHGEYQEGSLTLRLEGGRVGNHIRAVIGSPRFHANERVLLFVQGNGRTWSLWWVGPRAFSASRSTPEAAEIVSSTTNGTPCSISGGASC
jgi:hypothetical protein